MVNVSQILTVGKSLLTERIGHLDAMSLRRLDEGLRLVLALSLRHATHIVVR